MQYIELLDTVTHGKTVSLVSNDRELAKGILYFLNNPTVAKPIILFISNYEQIDFDDNKTKKY